MAGRGRASTLPAWMTAEGGTAGVDPAVVSQIQGQFDDQQKAEVRPSGQSNGESRPPSSRDERPATSSRDDRSSRGSRDERPREDRPRDDRYMKFIIYTS
jgi:hypothetical protein